MLDARTTWYAQTTRRATAAGGPAPPALSQELGDEVAADERSGAVHHGPLGRAIDHRFPWGRPKAEEVRELDLRRADACTRAVAGGSDDVYLLPAAAATS